MAANLFIRVLR